MALQSVSAPICTGEDLATAVPSPICPLPLSPHPQRVPSVLTAVTELYPAEMLNQVVNAPICIGDDLRVVVPSPSCPLLERPHAQRVPSVLIPWLAS